MRTIAGLPHARAVPAPIAEQLRALRQRRARRRRVAVAVGVAVPAVLLGARLVAGASADPMVSRSAATATTAAAPLPLPAPTSSTPDGLHAGLVAAFERAQAAADDAGHELTITSGFRTAEEQAALLEAEIDERGSLQEALWWVFPPDRSMHVQGLAVDVADEAAADWLAERGARFGLCRTLAWEWWHFEWRQHWEEARSCPAPARTIEEAPRP